MQAGLDAARAHATEPFTDPDARELALVFAGGRECPDCGAGDDAVDVVRGHLDGRGRLLRRLACTGCGRGWEQVDLNPELEA